MKKLMTFFGVIIFASAILTSCGNSSDSSDPIVGIYKNGSFNQIEIKEDGTYIISRCEPSFTMEDLQTMDPNAEVPLDCKEKSRGKWKLKGDKLELDVKENPHTFGVKSNMIFYNDLMYGGGTIE
jgi:hypothetical protein